MKRRILSLWFPRLASDMALRLQPGAAGSGAGSRAGPFALTRRSGSADHLHCLNPAAEAAGLRRGMAFADARALCPALATRPADLPREAAFLGALCRWAGRYSPWVACDGSDGLIADLTGTCHLFGGEAALVADVAARLGRAGISLGTGLAATRGAAHALARHGGGIAAAGEEMAAIGHLPPAALRLDFDTTTGLERLGLRTVAALAGVPRASLARRFGPAVLFRLDQALGALPEPVAPEGLPPHFGVRLTLPEPIGLTSDVMAGLHRLLDRLVVRLAEHALGARRLRLELRRVDGQRADIAIGLARPMRDAVGMAALFEAAVGEIDAGFGIDQLRLTAPVTETLAPRQIVTLGESGSDRLADLLTRIGNRIGFEQVLRMRPADSRIPERSFACVPFIWSGPEAFPPVPADRPLRLFPPEAITAAGSEVPRTFRWRQMRFTAAAVRGPERIAPEWWLDDPAWRSGLRDYWKVETAEGRRLWLFHTPQISPQTPAWFVQGEFA